jgi:L-fuculose-phosphate aldolase
VLQHCARRSSAFAHGSRSRKSAQSNFAGCGVAESSTERFRQAQFEKLGRAIAAPRIDRIIGLMADREQELREELVRAGQMMYERGWIAASDGNLTARLDSRRLLATPSGVCKGWMRPEDLIVCDLDGNKTGGAGERTTEMAMHIAIYRERPEIQAVAHAHPPVSTGFAVAGRPLNLALTAELIVSMGSVPLAEYGLPGTPALVDGMRPYIPKFNAILLANHGVVCYGESVRQAYARLETVEHMARIALVAELLGGPKVLPRAEIKKLFEARGRYGISVPNQFEPGNPVAAEDLPAPEEKIEITRQNLAALIDDALRAHGIL